MRPLAHLALSFLILLGCAGEQPSPAVKITSPQNDAVLQTGNVTVDLSAENIDIVPADGVPTPGRAHHHVFVDADLPPAGQAIPVGAEGIFHLGTGDSTLIVQDLAPGRHRLIAVLALGNHVPVDPWAVDTIFVVVESQD